LTERERSRLRDHEHARCPTCGAMPSLWTRQLIIQSLHAWTGKHGRPPSSYEWRRGSRTHPQYVTVSRSFGSWDAALEAAGLVSVIRRKRPDWTRDTVIRAVRAWHREHGRAPSMNDWSSGSEDWPSRHVVASRFGSWNLAIAAAGITPNKPFGQKVKVAA
jgi:hypothetical protein